MIKKNYELYFASAKIYQEKWHLKKNPPFLFILQLAMLNIENMIRLWMQWKHFILSILK